MIFREHHRFPPIMEPRRFRKSELAGFPTLLRRILLLPEARFSCFLISRYPNFVAIHFDFRHRNFIGSIALKDVFIVHDFFSYDTGKMFYVDSAGVICPGAHTEPCGARLG